MPTTARRGQPSSGLRTSGNTLNLYGESLKATRRTVATYTILELLTNLWMLLVRACARVIGLRRSRQDSSLNDFRPFRQMKRPLLRLCEPRVAFHNSDGPRPANGGSLEPHRLLLERIIKESEALAGFPFMALADSLIAIGGFLEVRYREFDTLHGELVEVVARRKGEIEGACLLLGVRPNSNSIRTDQSTRFAQSARGASSACEGRKQLSVLSCFIHCACAYERIGLLWAARGTLLAVT